MTPSTLIKSLTNPPHQTSAQHSQIYEVTSDPSCVWREDIRIYRFHLTQPVTARDGTPVVINAAYPDGHVVSVQGFIADHGQKFVDLQMFDTIEFGGSRVTIKVDATSVDQALDAKLQQMQQPGGMPNPDLLSKMLNPAHPVTSAAERERQREVEGALEWQAAFEASETARKQAIDDVIPATTVSVLKLDERQPAPLPTVAASGEQPESSEAKAPAHRQQASQPSTNIDEVGLLVESTAHKDVRFVLAAPGTPAAAFAVRAAMKHRNEGKTVLVIGLSNKSIDSAWAEAVGKLDNKVMPALRVGSLTREYRCRQLTPWGLACAKRPHILAGLEKLDAQIAALTTQNQTMPHNARLESADQLKNLTQQRDQILNDVKTESLKEVGSAPLVFANLSSALLCPALMARNFDVVIFFDVHLASVREVVALVGLATKAVCVIGDCRTYKAPGAERGSNDDIFEFCGVTQNINAGSYDPRMVPLRQQVNTHPNITRVASQLFYGGLLVNHASRSHDQQPDDLLNSRGVLLLDTSHYAPATFEFGDQESRFNPMSAALSIQAASLRPKTDDDTKGSCVLVAPYGAEHRLHEALIRDAGLDIQATMMNCPLSELADHVILDLTDAPGVFGPGWKLRGSVNNPAFRWLSQTITSGRKLVTILASKAFLLETLPQNAVLRLLFQEIERNCGPAIPFPKSLLLAPVTLAEPGCSVFADQEAAGDSLHRDAAKARDSILWHLPGQAGRMLDGQANGRLLVRGDAIEQLVVADVGNTTLRKLARQGVRVMSPRRSETTSFHGEDGGLVELTHRSPAEGQKSWSLDSRRCDEPCVLIDNSVLWFLGTKSNRGGGRPFLRFKGAETVRLLTDHLGLDYLHVESCLDAKQLVVAR